MLADVGRPGPFYPPPIPYGFCTYIQAVCRQLATGFQPPLLPGNAEYASRTLPCLGIQRRRKVVPEYSIPLVLRRPTRFRSATLVPKGRGFLIYPQTRISRTGIEKKKTPPFPSGRVTGDDSPTLSRCPSPKRLMRPARREGYKKEKNKMKFTEEGSAEEGPGWEREKGYLCGTPVVFLASRVRERQNAGNPLPRWTCRSPFRFPPPTFTSRTDHYLGGLGTPEKGRISTTFSCAGFTQPNSDESDNYIGRYRESKLPTDPISFDQYPQ